MWGTLCLSWDISYLSRFLTLIVCRVVVAIANVSRLYYSGPDGPDNLRAVHLAATAGTSAALAHIQSSELIRRNSTRFGGANPVSDFILLELAVSVLEED